MDQPNTTTNAAREAGHTPGPWTVEGESICSSEHCIAVIEDDGGYEASSNQRVANARLIAAAPDLLEACLNAMMKLERLDYEFWQSEVDECRAAIAKATGQA